MMNAARVSRDEANAPRGAGDAVVDIALQQKFWNDWNAAKATRRVSETSDRQRREALKWLTALDRTDLAILEAGCGSAWMTPSLKQFGTVVATDLSDDVLRQAAAKIPGVTFVAGDFMALPFEAESFDVIVTFEMLAHIEDHAAFMAKMARLLRPGGYLMMATQNGPVLEQFNTVQQPDPGQVRHWVDRYQLEALLRTEFDIVELFSVTPRANKGARRILNARPVQAALKFVAGDRIERMQERAWLGWTLMALARKP